MKEQQAFADRFRRLTLVAVAFLHLSVSRGVRTVFGVFYVALLDTFGWSRAAAAGAMSLSVAFEALTLPMVGSLTDRLGSRKTLLLGGSVLALGLGMSATIASILELYLWLGLVTALGIALIGMVPHVANLSREFTHNRGLMLGLAYTGGGLGIMLVVPLSQLMIGAWGWPAAYVGLCAVTVLAVIVPAFLFLPPGVAPESPGARDASQGGDWTVGEALGSRLFWFLFLSRVFASMGNQIILIHQIAHTVDAGYSKLFSAAIFGLMGVVSIFGRVLFGHLSDRLRGETVFALVQAVSCLGILALLSVRDTSLPVLLYVFALLYGIGQGSRALVLSAISARLFLGRSFGAIYGYFTLSIGIGGGIGAWLGGLVFDLTASYAAAFLIAIGCFAASVVSVWQVETVAPPAPPA
ncbi:MAG TPA: MFS transporter [Candidatus Binatia bacterium]